MSPLRMEDVALPIDMEIDNGSDDYGGDDVQMLKVSTVCVGPLHQYDQHVTSKTQRRTTISFGGIDTMHEVLHLLDYTPEETKSTWYDRVDLRLMKEAAKVEARLLDKGVLRDDENGTIRGLEGRTRYGSQRKRTNKINAFGAVFTEIETQIESGLYDEEAVADVYYEYSEKCHVEAQMLAARDAQDVHEAR